jgi:hypothetical protein
VEGGRVMSEDNKNASKDSFDVPVKKSPLLLFALLQIPIVIFMVLMMWFLYQSQFK